MQTNVVSNRPVAVLLENDKDLRGIASVRVTLRHEVQMPHVPVVLLAPCLQKRDVVILIIRLGGRNRYGRSTSLDKPFHEEELLTAARTENQYCDCVYTNSCTLGTIALILESEQNFRKVSFIKEVIVKLRTYRCFRSKVADFKIHSKFYLQNIHLIIKFHRP